MNDGGPAFPQTDLSAYGIGPTPGNQSGMSLLEWYVGQILSCEPFFRAKNKEELVNQAFSIAELAVQKALERRKT